MTRGGGAPAWKSVSGVTRSLRMKGRLSALHCVCMGFWASLAPASAQTAADEAGRRARIESMVREIRADYPDVATITVSALRDLQESNTIVLIDVRTDREREVSVLPGAISQRQFEAHIDKFAGRPVIAYCTIGVRSSSYARAMAERGVEVLNLEGSLLAWTHLGGKLRTADGAETRRVHVYGRRWNLVAQGYEAVW